MMEVLDIKSAMSLMIVLPLAAAIFSFLFRRFASVVGYIGCVAVAGVLIQLLMFVLDQGSMRNTIGGWGAPLGIDLVIDGVNMVMLILTSVVICGIAVYAKGFFVKDDTHRKAYFWPLLMFMWGALNALFLSWDLFNIFVTIELLSVSSVALVALAGKPETLRAAMRYFLVGLSGSTLYFLGVAFLYAGFGSLDFSVLSASVTPTPTLYVAAALMTTGLIMKIGLFPLHFWLPPVYASAAAPIVALSSALVIKAPFYVLLRLWVLVFHPLEGAFALYVLTLFGSIAIVWGALQAMKQPKLKVLIAYSTVSQVGYLFLLFPALLGADSEKVIEAIVFFVVAHSLAKVALFLCAGNFVRSNGSDFLDSYGSMLQKQPFTTIAFAMAAISLIGLPPSGGFLAKWLMLSQAFSSGNGWVIVMILIGGALGAVYLMKVMRHAFRATEKSYECAVNPIPVSMTFSAFAFALMVIMLGFFGSALHNLLQIKAMGIGGV